MKYTPERIRIYHNDDTTHITVTKTTTINLPQGETP